MRKIIYSLLSVCLVITLIYQILEFRNLKLLESAYLNYEGGWIDLGLESLYNRILQVLPK